MKSKNKWNADKASLYLLLGLMGFCLVFSIGWVLTSFIKEQISPPQVAQVYKNGERLVVITEKAFEKLVNEELSVFRSAHSATSFSVVAVNNPEEAIKQFVENPEAVLLISRQLTETEVDALPKSFLPLTQHPVAQSEAPTRATTLFLINDRTSSKLDLGFSAFVLSEKGQSVIMKNGLRPFKKTSSKVG